MSATPDTAAVLSDLKESLRAAIETYSNVHRGSGHFSIVTTRLFEHAREIVLECVEPGDKDNEVIFCTPRRAEMLKTQLGADVLCCLSSEDIGLPLAVRALVARRSALRRAIPLETGGGTARLVSRDWVVWAKAPGRFEAGTPAIINVIAFGRALQLLRQHDIRSFEHPLESQACAKDILYHDELDPFSGQELLEELTRTCMGMGVQVPTRDGTRAYINLDNAASTPTFAPIWETFCEILRQPAQTREDIVQEVKSICSRALGAPLNDYDVIFTSNTTEAINLVAQNLGTESERDIEPVVLNTLLEHNSNELPWRMVHGHTLIRLAFDEDGLISLQELASVLRSYNEAGDHGNQRIRLVAVSGASNVLGTFNDLTEIGRITHQYGAHLLVDGAQLVAHRKVAMASCGIDYLAFSAHKMYAPFGSGALVARKGLLALDPKEMELLESSGNENAAGIAALGKAFVLLQRIGMNVIQDAEQSLTAHALEQLSKVRGIRLFGVKSSTSVHYAQKGGVIAFMLGKPMPKQLANRLAANGGIGVRYGCHCSHQLVKRLHNIPPFLERVQWLIVSLFPQMELPGVVRVSLGIENSRAHVDALVAALNDIAANSKGATDGGSFRTRMDDFVQATTRRVYS